MTAPAETGDLTVAAAAGDVAAGVDDGGLPGITVAVTAGQPDLIAGDTGHGDLHLSVAVGEPATGDKLATPDPITLDVVAGADTPRVLYRVPRQFPSAPRALARLLIAAGLSTKGQIGTETPRDLQARLPYIRLIRVGGGSDLVNDYAQVDLEVFAATSSAGEQLAEAIRQFLTLPAPAYTTGVLIDRIQCLRAAIELPWADVHIRRYGASYRVVSRRQPVLTAS